MASLDRRNAHLVSGRSFAGTKTSPPTAAINWSLGPDSSNLEGAERVKRPAFATSHFTVALCTHGARGEASATLFVQDRDRAPGSSLTDAFRAIGSRVRRLTRKERPGASARKDPESPERKKLIEKRFDVVTKTLQRMHKENADAPRVYIALLATDPNHGRKGFGESQMRAALRAADDAGLPVYLEIGDGTNRKFYEGFGFEVCQTRSLSDDGDDQTCSLSDDSDEEWPDHESCCAMVRKARRDERPVTSGAVTEGRERRAGERERSQHPGWTTFTGKSTRRACTVARLHNFTA